MPTYIVGYAVIAISIVSVVASVLLALHFYEINKPKAFYRNVGFRYLSKSIIPWEGWEEAIDSIWSVLREHYPNEYANMMLFWVEVVPYSGVCQSQTVPTGFIRSGASFARINGTVRSERFFGVIDPKYVIVVRQLRANDTPDQNNAASGTGSTLDIGSSALFHEIAQHWVPFVLKKGWNPNHTDPALEVLEKTLDAEYEKRRQQARQGLSK